MKGGLILPYKNTIKTKETFISYINNSNISFLNKGLNGLILKSEILVGPFGDWIHKVSNSKKIKYYANVKTKETTFITPNELLNEPLSYPKIDYYKQMDPDENYSEPILGLVIKIILINDIEEKPYTIGSNIMMDPVMEQDFQEEVNIQTDIFLKTMQYLQPLCPAIVYADILRDKEDAIKLINNIIGKCDIKSLEMLKYIRHYIINDANLQLGIIAMENLSNSITLFNSEEEHEKGGAKKETIDRLYNIGRYALLKLALETGYNHNDFHKGNIMLCPSDNYFDYEGKLAFRPMIIDFGRTIKIPPNILTTIKSLVQKHKYTKALSYLCDSSYVHEVITDIKYAKRFYGWICGDYGISDEDYNTYRQKNPQIHVKQPKKIKRENNEKIEDLFVRRESAIDNNIKIMNVLHDKDPIKYPLIPVGNNLKNYLYNGMIGGKMNKTKRRRNIRKKSKRRY